MELEFISVQKLVLGATDLVNVNLVWNHIRDFKIKQAYFASWIWSRNFDGTILIISSSSNLVKLILKSSFSAFVWGRTGLGACT